MLKEKIRQLDMKKGGVALLVLCALIFISIAVLRRPDAVKYPQFYAEDGVWYSNAYEAPNFILPFLHPVAGYFQTVGRLVALFSLLFGVGLAPLIFNIFAIVIEILPAVFFLSRRFENVVSNFWRRFLIGVLYLTLPATFETHANITNSQWRLALLSFLIIIAAPSKKTWEKIFDNIFLAISGLSGPFVFFLLPIFLIHRHFTEHKKRFVECVIIFLTFAVQVWGFVGTMSGFYSQDGRLKENLNIDLPVLLKIVAGKIFVAGTMGLSYYSEIKMEYLWRNGTLPIVIGLLGFTMVCYALWNASLEFRLLFLFSCLVFLSGLVFPQETWAHMLDVRIVNRYFFFPILAWSVTLVWLTFKSPNIIIKYIAGILLTFLILFGIPRNFSFSEFKNWQFQQQASEFKRLSPGQVYVFKTAPNWNMTLTKK